MIRALALAAVLALSACAPQGDFCDLANPLRFSYGTIETLTDAELAELVGHNRRGERFCGWRP